MARRWPRPCRAVCDAIGIEVRAPQAGADREPEAEGDPLTELARASGFQVRPVSLREGWWRHRGEPMLGQLLDEGRPPVALLPAGRSAFRHRSAYELRDPEGRRHPVDERLAARIAPTGWAFYRPLPDEPLGFADLVRFCRGLRGLAREFGVVLIAAFVGALLGLAIPVASGLLVDQVLPEADLPRLVVTCGFLGVLTIAAAVFHASQGLLVLRLEGRVSATLIPAVWERLLRLPSRFFAGYSSGDLALRAMGLNEVFQRASGAVVTSIVTGLFSLFNLGLLFFYSWRLAIVHQPAGRDPARG